ncbi:MAG: hypothetical protein GF384_03145 [Elusimicrobia bacterium]|nr:hypothetical protein [Elusimicrobiota bacterium]
MRNKNMLFNREIDLNCSFDLRSYDDAQSPDLDFKGIGCNVTTVVPYNDALQFRTQYRMTQRDVSAKHNDFWNHVFDLRNRYTINRDMTLVSGYSYARNDARASESDFISRRLFGKFNYRNARNHMLSAGLDLSFIDYHKNLVLEKDTYTLDLSYRIPQQTIDHDLGFTCDMRRFPEVSANNFQEITLTYDVRTMPDIHQGIRRHSSRLSHVSGKDLINDYIDGVWEYHRTTARSGPRRFYVTNTLSGRFWSNTKDTVMMRQHYIEETVDCGVIFIQPAGGIISAGPIIGTRQRIDPHSRRNADPDDNPIYKNPLSNLLYGFTARSDISVTPITDLHLFFMYKDYTNYNIHTNTEFVDFQLSLSHEIAARLVSKAGFRFAQNVNDLASERLDNTIVHVYVRLEYLFDFVL